MPQLQAHLSRNGRTEFLDALVANGIASTRRQPPLGRVSASLETIVIDLGVPLIPALAHVLTTWLRARASRSVIIQRQNETIQVKGYPAKEVEKFLKGDASMTLIDTEKDDA